MALNLRQWMAMREMHSNELARRDEMTELMVAQLIAMVHNTSMGGYKSPVATADFMPSKQKEQKIAKQESKKRRKRLGKSGLPVVCEGFATLMRMAGAKNTALE